MSIKRILLPVSGMDHRDEVSAYAFAVARKFGAEVEVLHPCAPYLQSVTSVSMAGSAAQVAHDLERVRSQYEEENNLAKSYFEQLAKQYSGTKTTFAEETGNRAVIVTHRGFTSDLIVLGSAAALDSPFWKEVYDGALIHSSRPVLVAPTIDAPDGSEPQFGDHVVIAWNGSAESTRAITAAQPFLAFANDVRVVTVGDMKSTGVTPDLLNSYLALHTKNVSVESIDADGRDVADVITTEASRKPGTLLVMGAYSHARWRERFFGGVTEYVIHHGGVPVLMAH